MYRTGKTNEGCTPRENAEGADVSLGQGISDGSDEQTGDTTDNGSLSSLVKGIVGLEGHLGRGVSLVARARLVIHGGSAEGWEDGWSRSCFYVSLA